MKAAIANKNETMIRFLLIDHQVRLGLKTVIRSLMDYMLGDEENEELPNKKSNLIEDYLDKRDMTDELWLANLANEYIADQEDAKASYLENVFKERRMDSALESLDEFERI